MSTRCHGLKGSRRRVTGSVGSTAEATGACIDAGHECTYLRASRNCTAVITRMTTNSA